jgi:hypothetical protein
MDSQPNNPTTTTDTGSSCVICFEHISQDKKAVIKNCSHAFCFVCIKSWMQTTITCPLCKQSIDILQHSFTSDTSFQEEKVEAPNLQLGGDSGGGNNGGNVEEELLCLDHSYFIGEVQKLLQDAERRHRQLWQGSQTHRGLALWEKQQLETVENVIAELRNHKRKLQALLQFDPHSTLQDLYRLQDLLSTTWGVPVVTTSTRPRSPVRYSADDADQADDDDDDDFADDMSDMRISGKGGNSNGKRGSQRQSKNKTRTPANKIGQVKNRKGLAN